MGIQVGFRHGICTDYHRDLLPQIRTKVSMIWQFGKGEKHVQNEAHRSGDHRRTETGEAGRKAEDVAREAGVSQHTIYAW
jgi:hypothetical protein